MTQSAPRTYFDTPDRVTNDAAAQLGEAAIASPAVVPLLEGFPTPAVLLSQTRQVTALNRRALTLFGGKAPDDAIGRRLGEALGCTHSADMEAGCGTSKSCRECGAAKAIRFTRERDQADVSECRITAERDGRQVSFDLRVYASPIGLGEKYTLVALEDITHEKRRSALERIFFHDVGNIATAVNGIAQVMATVEDPLHSKELTAALSKSTVQLLQEIQAQRDLVSAENGDLPITLETTSANRIMETAADVYRASPLAEGKRVVTGRVEPDAMVETDMTQAVRSLGNLLKNALEAAGPGDDVRVWIEPATDGVEFRVSNPQVMPESAKLQIFQRSFSSKSGKGRGIGTYSVKLIVAQYLGGDVSFTSAEGAGTIFTMRLPRPSERPREQRADYAGLLVTSGLISRADLEVAQESAERAAVTLADAGVGTGTVSETDAYRTLARASRLRFIELDDAALSAAPAKLVPSRVARRHLAVPLHDDGATVTYAVPRPYDDDADRDIAFVSGRRTQRLIASPSQIAAALDRLYPARTDFERLLDQVRREAPIRAKEWSISSATASPVIDLCNRLLARAVELRASDIHMEPTADAFHIRYRVSGLLEQAFELPTEAAPPVTNRLKIMSGIDIFVRMRPQDGAFRTTIEQRTVDVRMSTLPTIYGEKIVLRIIDAQVEMSKLDRLGYDADNLERLRRALKRPDGLILVTGPTGSGKTTVLYAALNHLRTGTTNIVTVEDPVERRIDGVNQIAVNNRGGATFAAVLRSVLRQDPNVIMVGEVRDGEVAQIVGQAAYTGHLVLSSVHASDAASAITRLLNLGLEPFKVAECLAAIVAQRLVRRLCPECRVMLDPEQAAELGKKHGLASIPAVEGKGCDRCKQTRYVERQPVAEVLSTDASLRTAIAQGATAAQIRAAMKSAGMRSMRENGLALVAEGITTIDEINRVLADETPAAPAIAAAAARRVIVADDDPMVRMLVKLLLEQEGYEVHEAEDGRKAVEMARAARPDLLLVDLMMPEMDGFETIAALRGDTAFARTAIIALTVESSPQAQQRVFDLGADDYLTKPFDREVLSARVRAIFRRIDRAS